MTLKRILLVEDDPDIKDMMQAAIETLGHEVVVTDSLQGLVEALQKHDRYDACLIDRSFPEKSGGTPEVYGEMGVLKVGIHAKANGYVPAIIVCSGSGDKAQDLADKYGAQVLAKPFEMVDLAMVLGYALRRSQISETRLT